MLISRCCSGFLSNALYRKVQEALVVILKGFKVVLVNFIECPNLWLGQSAILTCHKVIRAPILALLLPSFLIEKVGHIQDIKHALCVHSIGFQLTNQLIPGRNGSVNEVSGKYMLLAMPIDMGIAITLEYPYLSLLTQV